MVHNEFDSIKIGLASPDMIREWSYGEVTKPETINYRTLKAEIGGLFCERIFGPTKDGACACGKYKNSHSKEVIKCEKCGVDVTTKKVRRERMGHIELAAPVSHIWYFKAIPSRMALVLDISPKYLEQVLYFADNIVLDPGSTPLEKGMVLNEKQYQENRERYGNDFRVGMGAEAIKELGRNIEYECHSRRNSLEIPNVRYGSYKLDVTHTLTSYLLGSYVNSALFTLVYLLAVGILILSAHTSAVLGRSKDTLTEQAANLCLKSSIVNSLGLSNFAVRPLSDHIRRCQTYFY